MSIRLYILALLALVATDRAAQAFPVEPPMAPKRDTRDLEGITIDENSGGIVPLDLPFIDDAGNKVTLRQYFTSNHPVIVQLSYFDCPMLCTLTSQGLVDSLNALTLDMGKDFEVLNISFNPADTPVRAAAKKKSFLNAYNRPHGAASWHFLTGPQSSIDKITNTIGFRYRWIESSKQFAHPAAIFILTPDGRISRYLYGVKYEPQTLRLSLVEASEGKVGSTVDRILLTCLRYDPSAGKYTMTALRLMSAAGAVTLVVLGSTIGLLLLREHRHRRREVTA